VKKKLTLALNNYLDPIREKRAGLSDAIVKDVIKRGAEKARKKAKHTMGQVKECLHQIID